MCVVYACDMYGCIYIDQLNTTIQASVKSTPYELVFGQPPRKTVFPGVTTCPIMEEDILDIVEEGRYYMYLGRDWVEFM